MCHAIFTRSQYITVAQLRVANRFGYNASTCFEEDPSRPLLVCVFSFHAIVRLWQVWWLSAHSKNDIARRVRLMQVLGSPPFITAAHGGPLFAAATAELSRLDLCPRAWRCIIDSEVWANVAYKPYPKDCSPVSQSWKVCE